MLSLNIRNDIVYFRDIKPEHLPRILGWYNRIDDFKYATGIDTSISLEKLSRMYVETAVCSNDFFVGIHACKENVMIGILKGSLRHKNKDAVWISSIVIDTRVQKRGYGSAALDLLLSYLKENNKVKNVFLSVVEKNLQGRAFWSKHKFREVRRIESNLRLQDKEQNVIIMHKYL